MKKILMLLSLGILSSSVHSQYDFTSDAGWTIIDNIYPSPGPGAPSPSATTRIDISSGLLNFTDAQDAINDIRAYRNIPTMCDNWYAEFDFVANGNSDVTKRQDMAYFPFILTQNEEHPLAITERDVWALTTNYTDNNALGAYVYGDGLADVYYIAPYNKLGDESWTNPPLSSRISIERGVEYHVTFERLDLSNGKITVENDNGFYETRCFDINPSVGDLNYLQLSNSPVGGWSRFVTGWVDNVDIMNCIDKNSCCINFDIMGLSDICLPSTDIAFYSVSSGFDNYIWSLSGGATIISGDGTEMIAVDFTGASGSVTLSVTIECACTETVLTKTISCPPGSAAPSGNPNSEETTHNISIQDRVIEIYPNPSAGVYAIHGIDQSTDFYTITSISGQIITEKQRLTSQSIDISNQKDGIYLLIISNNEEEHILKLIKQTN